MIDYAEILQRNMNAVPFGDFNEFGDSIQKLVNSAVATVELHIGQKLEPTEYTQFVERDDYAYLNGIGYSIITAKMNIISATDSTRFGNNWVMFDEPKTEFTYTAGFETIPDDISSVVYNLTMYEFNRTQGNSFGIATQVQQTGGATSNITRSVQDFYADELRRLDKYVNKAYYAKVI